MFKKLKYGGLCAFKNPDVLLFVPNEVQSKYVEIRSCDISGDGKLPDIHMNSGAANIKTLFPTTFAVSFHPALKMGMQLIERSMEIEGLQLFTPEFDSIRIDAKKALSLPWICRVYQIAGGVL